MGLISWLKGERKPSYFKHYKRAAIDYVMDDIVTDAQTEEVLELIRELLDEQTSNAFIAGGFAARVAGLTSSYGDVDIYCTNEGTYNALVFKVENHMGNILEVIDYSLTRCELRLDNAGSKVKVDLILRQDADGIEDVLEGFDMNWVMVGLDLHNMYVLYHPDAALPELLYNRDAENGPTSDNGATSVEQARSRINKYSKRRKTPPNDKQVDEVLSKLTKLVKTLQSSGGYYH